MQGYFVDDVENFCVVKEERVEELPCFWDSFGLQDLRGESQRVSRKIARHLAPFSVAIDRLPSLAPPLESAPDHANTSKPSPMQLSLCSSRLEILEKMLLVDLPLED